MGIVKPLVQHVIYLTIFKEYLPSGQEANPAGKSDLLTGVGLGCTILKTVCRTVFSQTIVASSLIP